MGDTQQIARDYITRFDALMDQGKWQEAQRLVDSIPNGVIYRTVNKLMKQDEAQRCAS